MCTLPCFRPPTSRGAARGPRNPIVILCQGKYCLPYTIGCPPGTVFDGASSCIKPALYDPFDALSNPELEAERTEQAMARRLQHRMRPRNAVELDGGIGFIGPQHASDVVLFSVRAMLAFRTHFSPRWGLALRAGVRAGLASLESSGSASIGTDSATTGMAGPVVEILPIFGPFGRFYFGPLAQASYMVYGKNTLRTLSGSVSLDDGLVVGGGVHGGVVLGETEKRVIHFSAVLAHQSGFAVLLTAGVGFDL
jgi:hypothetical protein